MRCKFNPWVGKILWSRKWQPPPVFLPGESHGQMSQAGYSPWGHKESDKTEHTCRHKLFTANICPRGCVSACFSNTCNFFLLYLLLRVTIFYHLQGSLVLHISLKVRQQECLLAQGVIVQDTVCVLLGGVFSVWRAPQTRSTPKKR